MGVGMTGWGQDTTRWETGMEAAACKMNGAAMGRTSPNSRSAQLCNSPPTITPEALFVIPATPIRHPRGPHVIPASAGILATSLPIHVLTRTTTRRIERRRRYGRKAAADVELLQRGEPSQ